MTSVMLFSQLGAGHFMSYFLINRVFTSVTKTFCALSLRNCKDTRRENAFYCKLLTVKTLTSLHSECSARKTTQEEKLRTMKRKANFFWNDLQCGDPKEKAKNWRENLRRVRSQNDMNKAVPQPPLFSILDLDDNKFAIRKASRELSCNELIIDTEEN